MISIKCTTVEAGFALSGCICYFVFAEQVIYEIVGGGVYNEGGHPTTNFYILWILHSDVVKKHKFEQKMMLNEHKCGLTIF